MATLESQRIRIQQRLTQLLKAGTFPIVAYDKSTLEPNDLDDTKTAIPKSISVNEIATTFEPEDRLGRRRALRRDTWSMQLRAKFDQEVSLELFEDSLVDRVVLIPKTTKLKQVELVLVRSEAIHPVQQQSAKGTQANFIFDALLGRI